MKFEEAYIKLNPRQREAVDAIEGPVMVIAGPGTGKTQILTLRIANILLKTDTRPHAILALTFTESAAANMRKRLVDMIGTEGYYVNIHTFHGFANEMIQEYPEYFPGIVGAQNAAEVDQIQIVRNIIEHGSGSDGIAFEHIRPFGDIFYYVSDILSAIKNIKNEGLNPDEFVKLLKEDEERLNAIPDLRHEKGKYEGKIKGEYEKEFATLAKNRELAEVYRLYEEGLRVTRRYDFEDMILGVIQAFESRPQFLLQAQERFQYFLVDEHQDTNGAQNRLLELLAGYYEQPNLFVVGDEKQAIFRFQGASLENFLYFQSKFPEAKIVYLENNYRSYQSILDSAGSVIRKNTVALKHDLVATRGKDVKTENGANQQINIISLRTPEAETFAVAELVYERIAAGVPAQEIAILYRQNRDAGPIAEMLARKGIVYTIESDRDVLADPDIRNILLLLEAIADFGNDALLAEALHLNFLNIKPLDIYKLISGPKATLYDRVLTTPIGERLAKWKKDSINKNFLNFFEELINESGFLAHLIAEPQRLTKVGTLTALFNEMRRVVGENGAYRLTDFTRHLEIIRTHHLPIKAPMATTEGAVRLMTAHKAKGLEFDAVIITGATDGHWGNRRNVGRFNLPFRTSVEGGIIEKNEDERRLFYMALTRARNEITITYARERMDGKAEVPSQFLGEIREDLRRETQGEEFEKKLEEERFVLLGPHETSPAPETEKEFLQELFRKRGLSATALNNYLICPWKYFYQNLLRIPSVMTLPQIYGTAIHSALENFFSARKRGEVVGKAFLIDSFSYALKRNPLTEQDFVRLLEKGKTTLSAYYDNYEDKWTYNVVTELRVKVPFEEIMLSGVLDKLELQADGREVVVVDYKTRTPQSRNWIEGKTVNATGDYKRQLIFYRILLEEGNSKIDYLMTEGQIDFVEPNERGIFKKESFAISDDETTKLREIIRQVIQEILDLAFWNRTCDDRECEWCKLRARME